MITTKTWSSPSYLSFYLLSSYVRAHYFYFFHLFWDATLFVISLIIFPTLAEISIFFSSLFLPLLKLHRVVSEVCGSIQPANIKVTEFQETRNKTEFQPLPKTVLKDTYSMKKVCILMTVNQSHPQGNRWLSEAQCRAKPVTRNAHGRCPFTEKGPHRSGMHSI